MVVSVLVSGQRQGLKGEVAGESYDGRGWDRSDSKRNAAMCRKESFPGCYAGSKSLVKAKALGQLRLV